MINVLVTLNRRAVGPVRTGRSSNKEMSLVLFDWTRSMIEKLVQEDLDLKKTLNRPPEVVVAVSEAYMGDSAFAQIDIQFLFELPDSTMERIGTVVAEGIEGIAKRQFTHSAVPTNVMLAAWWMVPERIFRFESNTN